MKMSGKVALSRDAGIISEGNRRFVELHAYEKGEGGRPPVFYMLRSFTGRQCQELQHLKKGDFIHFTAGVMVGINNFLTKDGNPNSVLKIDISSADITCLRRAEQLATEGIVEISTKVKETRQAEKPKKESDDYSFDRENPKELDILSDDFEGTNF